MFVTVTGFRIFCSKVKIIKRQTVTEFYLLLIQ